MSEQDTDTFVVRRAVVADAAALRAIRVEALTDAPDAFGTVLADVLAYPEARWSEMIASRCFFLAERDGDVVGMISTAGNDDRPGTHWMYGMYVTPSARGTGVAAQLVDAVSDVVRAQGAHELYLHVSSGVDRALAFYRRLGFRATDESFAMPRKPTLRLLTMRLRLD